MANLKVQTNIPEVIKFRFDAWKKWVNQGSNGEYKTYSIGVHNRGVDTYFGVYENEYIKVFKPLGNLKDRTLEVLKYEDGKYKSWKVTENGVDITPNAIQSPPIQQSPVSKQNFVPGVLGTRNNDIPVIQLEDEGGEKSSVSRQEFDALAKRVRELELKSGEDVQISDIPF